MPTALCIAIVGAESTGKSTLAHALAQALGRQGVRAAWVPEALREWCERERRTPHRHEQAAIATTQHERIAAAAAAHDVVVCDTTALMTAVYSRLIFGDTSLEGPAAAMHRAAVDITLLTALDLPWVPDGHQRDGPHVREPVDRALRELMQREAIAHAVISGRGAVRLARAQAAVLVARAAAAQQAAGSSLRSPQASLDPSHPTPGESARGPRPWHAPFTQLDAHAAAGARRWACACCVPQAEAELLRAAQAERGSDGGPSVGRNEARGQEPNQDPNQEPNQAPNQGLCA